MTAPECQRIGLAELTDYAAGELTDAEATALETHLFSCAACSARAAEFDALSRAIPRAARTADVGGFVTDAILNRLARDGVRTRTFALSPGAAVRCAVWDDDEVMALRLRGEFGSATEFTLTQSVGGRELGRTTGQISASHGEIIFATPAALVRQLPETDVELVLTARDGDTERQAGTYTLIHGGSMHR